MRSDLPKATPMGDPLVSVLMPVYNAERYVAEAVESILAQTFIDFEFLILDDGSTDSSLKILMEYAEHDTRIRLFSRPNTGLVGALNEMLDAARGEFIARMDADDIAMPERLERLVRYLAESPDCVLVGSRVIVVDPDGNPLTVMGRALTHGEIEQALLAAEGQMIYHPSVLMRKRAVIGVGAYREEYYPTEDLDLFLRLAEVGQIVNLAEPLLKYREHLGKISHIRVIQQGEACRRTLIEAHLRRNLSPPEAIHRITFERLNVGAKRRIWAWWALGAGHVATARKHAVVSLVRSPLSFDSWRLIYCAIRGR